jgi:hypothetical protein
VAYQTVLDFENNIKLRKYLISIIRDVVKEELNFKKEIKIQK